jgi:hypothetical protein
MSYQNGKVREQFLDVCERLYNPSYKTLAESIGVAYPNLIKWKNGQLEFGQLNLIKIILFIQGQNQSA